MKYPYIGKWEYINTTVIFTGESAGIEMGGEMSFRDDWAEINYKNITAEYLANTYGEVKSKEHAEFIVRLCENAGINVFPQLFDANHFVIKGGLSFHNCESIKSSELKQITIPLPPECESVDEWPKVGAKFQHKESKKIGDILALHGNDAWVIYPRMNPITISIDNIQKPKTPEQELRDELTRVMQRNLTYEQMVNDLIENFNITKKPQ